MRLSALPLLLSGRPGYALVGLILAAYVVSGLAPFRWKPPEYVTNGAVIETGRIRFDTPGLVRSLSAGPWSERAHRSHSFRVALRVRSSSAEQFGPARIFSFSDNPRVRNLTIGQAGADLVLRLRTPATSLNGSPDYIMPGVFTTTRWIDIDVVVRDERVTVLVDGQGVLSESLPPQPLSHWNRSYGVILGNEATGDRPWLGEMTQAILAVDGWSLNMLQSGELEAPSRYWTGKINHSLFERRISDWNYDDVSDGILNFLCFMPLGFVLVMARGRHGSLILAVILCAAISFCMETAQICFEFRQPSSSDWVLNTVGAFVGAVLARHLLSKSDPRRDPSLL